MRFEKRPAKKAKSGYTWRVSFEYRDLYGRKKTHSKSGFTTKGEAERYGREKQKELEGKIKTPGTMTVDEVWNEYIKLNLDSWSGSSVRIYSQVYRIYIKPKLGDVEVQNLTYRAMQDFFVNLGTLKKYTVKQVNTAMHKIVQYSINAGMLDRNPLDMVKIKYANLPDEPPHVTTLEEIKILSDYVLDLTNSRSGIYETQYRYSLAASLYVGYYTGLRQAELLALQWEDIDFDNNVIHVRHQVQRYDSDGRTLRKDELRLTNILKTKGSRSDIPMPEPLVDILLEWKQHSPFDLLFCDDGGNIIAMNRYSKSMKKASNATGIPFHTHMLRHAYITNLVLNGVDPKTVMTLARHSSLDTTLSVYTDITEEQKQKAVKVFSGNAPTLPQKDDKVLN